MVKCKQQTAARFVQNQKPLPQTKWIHSPVWGIERRWQTSKHAERWKAYADASVILPPCDYSGDGDKQHVSTTEQRRGDNGGNVRQSSWITERNHSNKLKPLPWLIQIQPFCFHCLLNLFTLKQVKQSLFLFPGITWPQWHMNILRHMNIDMHTQMCCFLLWCVLASVMVCLRSGLCLVVWVAVT